MNKIKLSTDDFEVTEGEYIPRDVFISIYNLNEIIEKEQDFSNIQQMQTILSSLIKNSSKAKMHFIVSGDKLDKDTFSSNILSFLTKRIAIGEIDESESKRLFDDDISYKSMPNIKGRGFTKIGDNMVEVQLYKSGPEDFNTELINPLFKELSKTRAITSEHNFSSSNKNLPIRKLNRSEILTVNGKIDYNRILENN